MLALSPGDVVVIPAVDRLSHDTTNMLVRAMLGAAASLSAPRGRNDARAKGVKFGRKPTLPPHQQKEARKRIEAGEMQRSIARSYNVSQS